MASTLLQPALTMEGVSKRFPGMLAVDRVDFEVFPGEVHALMGENGAGKSTLMRILAGSFDDYTGDIRIGGREVAIHSPADAREQGIGMVYQELSLAQPITIAENLLAGRLPTRWGMFLDRDRMLREARVSMKLLGLDLDPTRTIGEISPHEAQLVEIAKVLGNHPCILVLDEPTSSLSRDEVRRLFDVLRELRNRGLAIVYISHHLPEVFEIADRVTVLRDGKKIATWDIHDVTPRSLVQMMVGEHVDECYLRQESFVGDPVLEVEHLTRKGFFHDVSFNLRAGEILGLAGLSGAGRTELARSLCGLDPVHYGSASLAGASLALNNYPANVARGIIYLTEDRKQDGLFLRLPVSTNLLASRPGLQGERHIAPGTSVVEHCLRELSIAAASPDVDAGALSGGNQQKVLLGKCLNAGPRVLILDEPTRGVDVNAKRNIHEAVVRLAETGASVLLISSDLPELAGLSDRVLVMRRGGLIGELPREALSEETLLLAANGQLETCHGVV